MREGLGGLNDRKIKGVKGKKRVEVNGLGKTKRERNSEQTKCERHFLDEK